MKKTPATTAEQHPLAALLSCGTRVTINDGHYRVMPAPREDDRNEDEPTMCADAWVDVDGGR